MGERARSWILGAVASSLLLTLSSCGDDEVRWEAGREAVTAEAGDAELAHDRWIDYRDGVVEALGAMRTVLEGARGEGTVVDRDQIDALLERVSTLREQIVAEANRPSSDDTGAIRRRIQSSFEGLRKDVDALLTRLGHDPAEMAPWQDAE